MEGGGEFLLETSSSATARGNISATYNGPVSESIIAARNRDREAGYKIWASTLPAPADCIGVKSASDV